MIGILDLMVRYRDPTSQRGVAVDEISGIVKNSKGVTIETITPVAETDAEGVIYGVRDYDATNTADFPGEFLTVDWITTLHGIQLPTFAKTYDYRPTGKEARAATTVSWPADARALFYEVYRERDGASVFIGRSFGNVYVDRYPFENEAEARSYCYFAYAAISTPGTLKPLGGDYEIRESSIPATTVQRVTTAVCLIEGRILDVFGLSANIVFPADDPTYGHQIVFSVNTRDYHIIRGESYIVPEDVYATLNARGEFSAALVQDLVVELRVPLNRFRGRFVVPRKDRAILEDLNMEILRDY